MNRANTSAYQSSRSRGVNYDDVPSPRASTSSHRIQNGVSTPSGRGKSNLSRSAPPDSPVHNQSFNHDNFDDGGNYGGDDGYDQPVASTSSPRHTSFTEMDQDEEDDMEPLQDRPPSSPILPSSSSNSRGKSKSKEYDTANDDEQVEDEIERGLQEIDDNEEDEQEEEVRPQSKGKRVRVEEPQKKTREATIKKRRVQRDMPLTGTVACRPTMMYIILTKLCRDAPEY